jgi:hypothetical protein
VIVFGVDDSGIPVGVSVANMLAVDPADVTNKVKKYTDYQFTEFSLSAHEKDGSRLAVLELFGIRTPLVFTKPGTFPVDSSRQSTAFGKGTIYFRHGAKSEPGTHDDLREFVDREVARIRSEWLDNIRKLVEAPPGSQIVVLRPDDSGLISGRALPIRLTDDPNAPAFQRISHDETYPYRQTELVQELNRRLQGKKSINQFDIQCVRQVHDIESRPEYFYQSKYGSPQYSEAFVEWLILQHEKDSDFFDRARDEYRKTRQRRWNQRFRRTRG